jgi:hypothetical protein
MKIERKKDAQNKYVWDERKIRKAKHRTGVKHRTGAKTGGAPTSGSGYSIAPAPEVFEG